ncbi:hypothetical protein ACWD45_32500 [Streptomyces rubiginosohelvolus]
MPEVLVALCVNVFLSPGHLAFLTKAEQGLRELVAADLGSLADHGGTSCDASVVDAARRAEASLGALAAIEKRLTALGALREKLGDEKPPRQAAGKHLTKHARNQAIRAELRAGRHVLDVAADVGLTTARIYQIRNERH